MWTHLRCAYALKKNRTYHSPYLTSIWSTIWPKGTLTWRYTADLWLGLTRTRIWLGLGVDSENGFTPLFLFQGTVSVWCCQPWQQWTLCNSLHCCWVQSWSSLSPRFFQPSQCWRLLMTVRVTTSMIILMSLLSDMLSSLLLAVNDSKMRLQNVLKSFSLKSIQISPILKIAVALIKTCKTSTSGFLQRMGFVVDKGKFNLFSNP